MRNVLVTVDKDKEIRKVFLLFLDETISDPIAR